MKHIVIIGAGISGLATAWWIHKKFPLANITIIEKEAHIGGCIQLKHYEHIDLDVGPKGFLTQGDGLYTLQLIKELQLNQNLIFSDPSAKERFIYYNDKMHKVSLGTLLSNGLISSCFKDLCASRYNRDSSVYEFLNRHCSPKLIHNLLNPAVLATRAGYSHLLSAQMAFPALAKLEAQSGSLLLHFLKQKLFRKQNSKKQKFSLASLQPNLFLLIETLKNRLPATWLLSSPVTSIEHLKDNSVLITTAKHSLSADLVIYTGSISALLDLWNHPSIRPLSTKIIPFHMSNVSLAWESKLPKLPKGYGALFADEPPLLGIVYSSQIFPSQHPKRVTMSLMLDGIWHEETAYAYALSAITKYLHISTPPEAFALFSAPEGLPQHRIGFLNAWHQTKQTLPPTIKILGQNIAGPGINRCIAEAFRTVATL